MNSKDRFILFSVDNSKFDCTEIFYEDFRKYVDESQINLDENRKLELDYAIDGIFYFVFDSENERYHRLFVKKDISRHHIIDFLCINGAHHLLVEKIVEKFNIEVFNNNLLFF